MRWIPVLLVAAMGLPIWAQDQPQLPSRYPLSSHLVAQTLSANGMEALDEDVTMLANVVATEPAPVLEILSIEPLGNRSLTNHGTMRSLVKLGCRLPGTCLPFYSIVNRPESPAETSPGMLRGSNSESPRLKPESAIVIRAGAHATLVMDDARSHIEVAVVCLENGISGHKVHVATPDHKQVYVADVVSASLLRRSY